jgi:hypothetical protein
MKEVMTTLLPFARSGREPRVGRARLLPSRRKETGIEGGIQLHENRVGVS